MERALLKANIVVTKDDRQYVELAKLVALDCIVGSQSQIPGLRFSELPLDIAKLSRYLGLCPRKTIYAHKISLSNMSQIDAHFTQYLKMLCVQTT